MATVEGSHLSTMVTTAGHKQTNPVQNDSSHQPIVAKNTGDPYGQVQLY